MLVFAVLACLALGLASGCAVDTAQQVLEQWQLQYPGLETRDDDGDGRPDVAVIPVVVQTQPGQPPATTQMELPGSREALEAAQLADDAARRLEAQAQRTVVDVVGQVAPWILIPLLLGGMVYLGRRPTPPTPTGGKV